MLKLIHSADWHLGHSLHGMSRDHEHALFLEWLLDRLEEQQADALIVAGDIFDSANPPATAQSRLYAFLSAAKRRLPDLDVILVAGNHDSGSRLAAPAPILHAFGVHVIGGLPRRDDNSIDWDALCLPLHDRDGQVAAWCGAMPFLRNADLSPAADAEDDPLIEGVKRRYTELFAALRAKAGGNAPMLATGHCYMTGGRLSELSERKILGGNQHALPASLFPDDLAYVALGHLHLAQRVGGRETLRYSGSPIPLSLDEDRYRHQVLAVTLDGADSRVEGLMVPRIVDILRLPEAGPADLDTVIGILSDLALQDRPLEAQPYLEVRVLLERPQPDLRKRIDDALDGRPVRLLKVSTRYTGSGGVLGDVEPARQLESLQPLEVFERRYAQSHEDAPEPQLLAAFNELVETVQEAD